MSITADKPLPHWQLDSIFPGLDSGAYKDAKGQLEAGLNTLDQTFTQHGVGSGEALELTDEVSHRFEQFSEQLNELADSFVTLRVFVTGFTAVDAFNEQAQAEMSQLRDLGSQFSVLNKRFIAWLGRLDLEQLADSSPYARAHKFSLEQTAIAAEHLMGDEAEALASALNTSGGGAWVKLHTDLTSRHTVEAALPGQGTRAYGLAELKTLAHDPNRQVRRLAKEAELELLSRDELAFAAAMNGVKGEVNTLTERRGWGSALEQTLFGSNISPQALSAMQAACEASFPDFRRYLRAKAKFLGLERLEWFDLFAPVSVGEPRSFSWEEAKRFVVDAFGSYSAELADYAQLTFDKNWHDVPPRKGKRSGAFCASVPLRQESRIMLNFSGTLDDVFTVAHELGHGFHNQQMYLAGRDAAQRSTPMTLAETASIFCETIVVNKMLSGASDADKLAILEQDLLGATQLVVDIHSRFLFENAVFEKRLSRELSVDEFKATMLDAQAQTYGDAVVNPHPLMWAQKGHYYSTTRSYYNFPYTFGYLFGLGIYATYQDAPGDFQASYNDLLNSTGMADARSLGERFGLDIEDKAFWARSLDVAKGRIDDYERLVDAHLARG